MCVLQVVIIIAYWIAYWTAYWLFDWPIGLAAYWLHLASRWTQAGAPSQPGARIDVGAFKRFLPALNVLPFSFLSPLFFAEDL